MMAPKVMFKRLAIIGTGLMGGSLALAAKQRGLVQEVVGYSRRLSTAQQAQALGVVDSAVDSLAQALEGADAVYIAAPVAQFPALFAQMAPLVQAAGEQNAPVLFDAGSTKSDVLAAVDAVSEQYPLFASRFVPCHPITGAERHGPLAADALLHAGRTLVMCQSPRTSPQAYERVKQLWLALDVVLKEMSAQDHDDMFAAVSHLPHWLAYAYVSSQLSQSKGAQFMAEGGGGFRDFTRIAASSPEMWMDIFRANRQHLLEHLSLFEARLAQMKTALQQGDEQSLQQWLQEAAHFRAGWKQF